MNNRHSQIPWGAFLEDDGAIEVRSLESGYTIAVFNSGGEHSDEEAANADRIVACVNACEGINPRSVLMLIRLARALISDDIKMDSIGTYNDAEIDLLREQAREILLDAEIKL